MAALIASAAPAAWAYQVPAEHPRILVTKAGLDELAKRAKGPLAADYAYAKQRADRAVTSGAQYINNQWAQPNDLLYLGLAYLVERQSGADAQKYADAAAKEMKQWLKAKGGDCHFGYHAVCYDWVYDGLSEADRKDLGNRLGSWLRWYTDSPTIKLQYGQWEYNQTWGPSHLNTMHCRDGLTPKTFIALAILGAPTDFQGDAQQWLDSCDKRVPAECVPTFDAMGGVWAESFGHGSYGPVTVPAWTFEAWRTGMGVDWYKPMKPWSYLPEETAWVSFLMFPHSSQTAWIDDNQGGGIGAYLACAPMLAKAFRDPVAAYWSERGVKENWSDNHWARLTSLPTDMKPLSPKEAGYPTAWFFRGAGQAYMRGAWDDPNATWAFFGVGPHLAGHQHDDEGHFLITRKGSLVSKGGGKGGGNDSDCYWGGSLVFNVLTIFDPTEKFRRDQKNENDGGLIRHVYSGRAERGSITAYAHSDDYTYAAGDITKGYAPAKAKEVTRQFLYLRGPQEFFVVFDRVEATKGELPRHFMLHVPSEPAVTGKEAVKVEGHVAEYSGDDLAAAWESSTDGERNVASQGKSRIFMRTLLPAGAVITKRGGKGYEHWGHPLEPTAQYNHTGPGRDEPPICPWRLEVAAPPGSPRQYFLHVFHVTDGQGPMPPVTASSSGSAVTVKIDGSPRKYEVTFALAGATSLKVSCKGQGAYEATVGNTIDVSAQTIWEERRAKAAAGQAAPAPAAAPASGGAASGARPGPAQAAGDAPAAPAAAPDPRASQLFRDARAAERAGMKDLARTLYEKLVKEYPDSPLAAEAKKKLE